VNTELHFRHDAGGGARASAETGSTDSGDAAGTREPIRVLLVEDTDDDATLVGRAIRTAGFAPTVRRVQTSEGLLAALRAEPWDVVICDHSLPQFSSAAALACVQAERLDLPFIVVSGTINEESAVTVLRAGAHDFVTKQSLARLGPSIRRELRDAKLRAELRSTEEQFRQAQKMEAIGQLAGGIAHDFNNLLTAILGYSELMRDRVAEDPELLSDLEEIHKAGERARSLTAQLLAFSRKQILEPQVLDLNRVVAEAERMLSRVIGEHIQLETVLDPNLLRVEADTGQLHQVLMNLAVNARDAMPRGGTLRIVTSNTTMPAGTTEGPPVAAVSLAVTDTGCGMAPDVQARIFEPFFTTKAPGKGTGLGLAMVFGVVAQSGGRIEVASEPAVGTTFTVYLPTADATAKSAPSSEPPRVLKGCETVLVVEDERAIRDLVRKVLTGYGYTVLEAADGFTALSVAETHPGPIHLLLSDIVMPRISGPDLAQRVVADRSDLRVLYMSGFASGLGTGFGALSPAVALLHKPFTAERLARKVRECLDR
jgi:signal transduction histidine kinase